jgi:hypothetical protein
MDYQEFIAYQTEYLPFGEPPITQDDLMYFEFNENWKDDLLRSANFYVEALAHNSVYLKVPTRVVFIADYSHNARAAVFDGRGLIVWHGGLLFRQMEILDRHQAILDSLADTPLSILLDFLDNHPSILFFQMVQHFTFYHEFAHIIQNQQRDRETTQEYMPNAGFDQNRHLLEIDADEFSALFLASHVLQYAHGRFQQVNQDIITRMVAFFLVPILTDSISIYPDDISNLNMNQGVHPHPIFRVLFIAMVVAEFVNQRYMDEFRVEHREIINYTIDVASKLTGVDLNTLWSEHYLVLMQYFRDIREAPFPDGFKSAVDAWNEEIEQREG